MIKAILFDADGVLIRAERFSLQLARDRGISTDLTLPFFTGIFQDCLIDRADLKTELSKYLPTWGWKGSTDEFLNYWFKAEHQIEQPLINYIQTLRQKGLKCYLATNNERYRVEYMVKEMGFGNLLDKAFSSASLGFKKPDIDFFRSIVAELNLNKTEILFWDDSIENINAAREFGINAEIYSTFDEFKSKMQLYLEQPTG